MTEIKAIVSGLAASPDILEGFVRSIPAERLALRRGGKEVWTIAEHLSHLASVQPMLTDRVRRILTEDEPVFVPFIPGEGHTPPDPARGLSVTETLGFFRARREEQVEILKDVPLEGWERLARHPEYEDYGLAILARHMLMHDHWHMYRMEELWLTRDEFLTVLPG